MAIYLGHSPQLASNIPLIMNIATGLVSPQFHVVHDDHFSTTQSYETNSLHSNWTQLFQEHSDNVLANNPILHDAHTLGLEWDSPVPSLASGLDLSPSEGDDFLGHNVLHANPSSERGISGPSVILTSEGVTEDTFTSNNPAAMTTTVARPGWNN